MYNSYVALPVSNYQYVKIMIQLTGVVNAYFTARSNKRKSEDQVLFEVHWEANCVGLYESIINRNVRPTAYTFITDKPRPREVFASDMATRILHHLLDIRLRPLLEARLSPRTFNNRIGMGQAACQNAVINDIYAVSRGFTRDAYIIKLDLKGCFPNIRQDVAYKQLEDVIMESYDADDKDDILYVLSVCVFSYPTDHCYRKSPLRKWSTIPKDKSLFHKPHGIGAAIGHLIWQNAVNYYFHEIDEWVIAQDIRHERYVDDWYFVVNNKELFLSMIPQIREQLGRIGARLNENKFYCQHYTKGCECLGVHIKMDRVYVNNRIVRNAIAKVKSFNRHIGEYNVHRFLSSVNSYLGLLKNVNGFNQAMRIVRHVSKRWLEYVEFDRKRVCFVAKRDYTQRNITIKQFNLTGHETRRKRHHHPTHKRANVGNARRNGKERRKGVKV